MQTGNAQVSCPMCTSYVSIPLGATLLACPVCLCEFSVPSLPKKEVNLPSTASAPMRPAGAAPSRQKSVQADDLDQLDPRLTDIASVLAVVGGVFEDTSFPASEADASVDGWARARECGPARTTDSLQLIGTPVVGDVVQGQLGDCWLLSVLDILAGYDHGRLVFAMFPGQKSISAVGAYCVRVFRAGEAVSVLLDDRLPVRRARGTPPSPAFCQITGNKLWPCLAEKAMAALSGGYQSLVGGHAAEALESLTGWPCQTWELQSVADDADMLWAQLQSASDLGFLLACATPDNRSVCAHVGLTPNHGYAVLQVYTNVRRAVDDQVCYKLLKIRNPHGRSSWAGDWSPTSPLWTDELRAAFGSLEPGVMFMQESDVILYFRSISLCPIRKEWTEARIPLLLPSSWDEQQPYVIVECFAAGEAIWAVSQPAKRSGVHPRDLAVVVLMVPAGMSPATVDFSACAYIGSSPVCGFSSSVAQVELFTQIGFYVVVPLSFGGKLDGVFLPVTFVALSAQPLVATVAATTAEGVRHAARHFAASAPESKKTTTGPGGGLTSYLRSDGNGVLHWVENRTSAAAFFDSKFLSSVGAFVSPRSSVRLEAHDVVPANHCKLLWVLAAAPGVESYKLAYEYKSSLITMPADAMAGPCRPATAVSRSIHDAAPLT